MNVSRRVPIRLFLALVASGAALLIGAASASGQSAPSGAPSTGGGVSAVTGSSGVAVSGTTVVAPAGVVSSGVVSSGVVAPGWCCSTGYGPGLTVVGQATVDGQDTAARDAAIAKAIEDATDQAKTAADAADIQLGAIVDLQVSAMPLVYPMMGGATGSSPGSPGGGTIEPAPAPYMGSVTVTITWAIG